MLYMLPLAHGLLVPLLISVVLDFSALIDSAFTYANSLLPVLGPIAGLGIGFTLALGAVAWISGMLGKVFSGKR